MIGRRPGTNPMTEARGESNGKVDRDTRYRQIKVVLGDRKMTAHEIADEMHKRGMITTSARQEVAPRISELCNEKGLLEPVGKKADFGSGRMVTVFQWRA